MKYVFFFLWIFEEKNTVFGAAEKLKYTVREAYRRVNPNAIFVTTSCASGIIGEDVGQVTDDLTEELGLEVQGAAIFHHDPLYDNGDKTSDALAQDVLLTLLGTM